MSGELRDGTYVWHIKDDPIMDHVEKIEPGERLDSEIFEICGAKWFLRLFPNGTKKKYEGRVSLFLQLCSLPPSVRKLKIKLVLGCDETNTQYSDVKNFSDDREFGGWTGGILNTYQLRQHKKLTFSVSITVISKELVGADPNTLPLSPMGAYPPPPPVGISPRIHRSNGSSPAQQTQLQARASNGQHLPPHHGHSASMVISGVGGGHNTVPSMLSVQPMLHNAMPIHRSPGSQVPQQQQQPHFMAHSLALNGSNSNLPEDAVPPVPSNNNNNNPNAGAGGLFAMGFEDDLKFGQLEQIQIRLNSLALNVMHLSHGMKQIMDMAQLTNSRLDESALYRNKAAAAAEESSNNDRVMMQTMLDSMQRLKRNVHQIKRQLASTKSGGVGPDSLPVHAPSQSHDNDENVSSVCEAENASALKLWLADTVKLGQYYDAFVENGLEDMSVVAALTENELTVVGVTKLGHRKKLLLEMEKYRNSLNARRSIDDGVVAAAPNDNSDAKDRADEQEEANVNSNNVQI